MTGGAKPADPVPERAEVVVVGGGILGCSVAYHLTLRGREDVVVLEQGSLTGGTTWHAAGLVGQLKSSHTMTQLAKYSTELFQRLEDETGHSTGCRTRGSLLLAADEERWQELMRGASMAKTVDVDVDVLTPTEAGERWPLMNTDDLVGALWFPEDGQVNPVDTTMALAKGARSRGARIIEGVHVEKLAVDRGRIAGVETEFGRIATDRVVLCAGMWTRQLAATAGVNVPLQACEHFYLVTEPIDGLSDDLAVLRDPGNYTYFKEETGKLLVGFFEPTAKPWKVDGIPRDFSFGTLGEDWDHIGPVFERSIHRVPVLGDAGIQVFFNGPEAFTPDGKYYVGETPEVDGCFVAAGFNSIGIQSAGGAGRVVADWVVDGHPPMDLWDVDIRRTFPLQADPEFLGERVAESLGLLYAMHWPFRQYESARDSYLSPLHPRLDEAGAVFGETSGWERPNWYASGGTERRYEYSYGRQNWFEASAAEHRAVREGVGLFDQTSFSKFTLAGSDAAAVLGWICANDISAPIGKVTYTQWLNDRGGIEADLTVTRVGESEFFVVTSAGTMTRDFHWLRRHIPDDADARLTDVTHDHAVLGVMGPDSRELLSSLTSTDLGNDAFPFLTSQPIELAGVELVALRATYVGELGWELYPSAADAATVYDAVVEAGRSMGLRHAGFHALNSLRLEAGYRHWGHDITDEDNPIEAGLGFAVAFDKPGGFIGRESLLGQRDRPRRKRLVQFRLADPEPLLYHDEPIVRDGRIVGRTTSGMYGHTVGAALGMGYVHHDGGVDQEFLDAGSWAIEVAGDLVAAEASLRSFYDPTRQRVRM